MPEGHKPCPTPPMQKISVVPVVSYAVLLWINPANGKSEILEFQNFELDALNEAREVLENGTN